MDLIAALLATLAAGLFAGAAVAVYIAFVEHPARGFRFPYLRGASPESERTG